MTFSIVTPSLNGLSLLKSCAESVHRQSDIDVEHIIQDGASSDGTREWLEKQSGLKWESKQDKGMYDALNRGLRRSTGDILAWLNTDEQYLDGTLAKVAALFDQHPGVDLISGNYIVVDENGDPLSARREIPFRTCYVMNGILNIHSCAFFFRRRLWEKCGEFDSSYKICGDKEWILRVAQNGTNFLHHNEFFSIYILSGSNLSCLPAADIESKRIMKTFNVSPHKIVRNVILICRRAEKLFRGCYGRRKVSYSFIDKKGCRKNIVTRIGSRWCMLKGKQK